MKTKIVPFVACFVGVFIAGLFLVLISCSDPFMSVSSSKIAASIVPVTSISFTTPSVAKAQGSTYFQSPNILPVTASNPAVSWSSSNTAVATVNASGTVSVAASGGSTTIKASATDGSGVFGSYTVNAVASAVTSISFTTPSVAKAQGSTYFQAPNILPVTASNPAVSWSSSNTSVATVDAATGVVTPVTTSGTATIQATAKDGSGVSGSYTLSPYKALSGLSFSTTSASKTQGSTVDLSAYLTKNPTDATEPLVWVSNTGVASVDSTGKLKVLLTAGTAQITTQGQYSGVITSIPFTLTSAGVKVGVSSVSFSSHSTETMSPGSTFQRLPSVLPGGATDTSLTWVSSNTSVATVASDGTVKMVSSTEGDTAVIRATSNDNPLYYDEYSVTPYIAKPLTSFNLSSTSGTLSLSGTKSVTFSYTYAPSNTTDSISNYYIFPTDLSLTVTVTNTGPGSGSITVTANSATGDSYYYFGNSGSQHDIYQIKVTN